jgi:hypothetical protein
MWVGFFSFQPSAISSQEDISFSDLLPLFATSSEFRTWDLL